MSGIFTDKRDRSQPFTVRRFSDAGVELTPIQGRLPDLQETTSYRSGRELSQDESIRQDSRIFGSFRDLAGPHDTGHDFQTVKWKFISTNHPMYSDTYKSKVSRLGPLIYQNGASTTPTKAFAAVGPLGSNDIVGYGQRAISATAPTNPVAGLLAMLGEILRDGIPQIPGVTTLSDLKNPARSAGGEFLNVEFGWKPLISDLTKLAKSIRNASRTVSQLSRDSGTQKSVRRRFSFPVEESSSVQTVPRDSLNNLLVGYTTAQATLTGEITVVDKTTRELWFSGAYSYYLPMGDDLISKCARYEALANKLLGTRLTPSVLYQLAPWSWMADWFVDFGGAIKVADLLSSDNLVLKYGYLMCHTSVVRTVHVPVRFGTNDPGDPYRYVAVQNTFQSERKERWRASPFGFSVSPLGFSDHQWHILGALGMTKAPRVAW